MPLDAIQQAVELILPECILIGTACVMFLAGPFLTSDSGQASPGARHRWGALALLALAAAAWQWSATTPQPDWDGPFRLDALAYIARGVSLGLGTILVLTAWSQFEDGSAAECHACLLSVLAGVNLTAAANDLVLLFLGLELVSIPTYVLLYLPRKGPSPSEAAIKYFLLSVFSSGLFLYGAALLYGSAGTTSLPVLQSKFLGSSAAASPLMLLAVPMLIAGLGFRITAVPFHFYAPDVFQASPAFSAAMLSFIPKVVGFLALWRLTALPDWAPTGLEATTLPAATAALLAVFAGLTMFVGNLMALRQTDLHRLLAYSSIAHAGYMLVGAIAGRASGVVTGGASLLFYLVVYGVMTLGVFAGLLAASRTGDSLRTVQSLAGLGKTHPVAALLLTVFLFSLTGLPPTAGFLGKFYLIVASWSQGSAAARCLAVLMAVNAAIAAWYYLRLVATMYLDPPARTEPTSPGFAAAPLAALPAWAATVLCAVATLGIFLAPQWLWNASVMAAEQARGL